MAEGPSNGGLDFGSSCRKSFRASGQGHRHERLMKLQQETTGREYRRRFER
uniref:Uncharacterized protein n=1 Tax=Cucumis melo TaxID=3656 RepID=A0A9I9DA91_CUCME